MLTALGIGFGLGWIGSMPLAGAVSIFVFHRGLAGRIKQGLALSAGAAVAEAAWCLLAVAGAQEILERWPALQAVAKSVGGLILIALGLYFLLKRTQDPQQSNTPESATSAGILKDFWLGVTLVAGNISIPINWMALIAVLVSWNIDPTTMPKAPFVLGVALGILGWFAVLLKILQYCRDRFQPKTLMWILRAMGVALIVTGAVAILRLL